MTKTNSIDAPDAGNSSPLFTNGDYDIVNSAMTDLSLRQQRIVKMRFWEDHSIAEIAASLKISWETTYRELEAALAVLKIRCSENPNFSLNRLMLKAA
jgi:DNA-directed RNA polymerase specialized sigma24 family protein